MLDAVRESAEQDHEWLIALTSDHGGHSTGGHSRAQWLDDAVPLIFSTEPPLHPPLEPVRLPAYHYDIAPTVLTWLGVPLPSGLDGKVQCVTAPKHTAPNHRGGELSALDPLVIVLLWVLAVVAMVAAVGLVLRKVLQKTSQRHIVQDVELPDFRPHQLNPVINPKSIDYDALEEVN